jgi:simple sugar transport system ATP-binding protein
MTALSLEAVGVCKHFGRVTALDDVSLRVRPGRIHALLGENGAGKSTLVKCLMGTYQADAGRFLVDGRPHHSRTPREAHAAGIGMVYQHFTLVAEMTVLENLMLAQPDIPFTIDWQAYRQELEALLTTMPFRVRLDAPVASLAAGEKQKVEILKQLHLRRRLLVLDEPTSVLTPAEADEMLGLLRDLAHDGALTVVLITHKFREVLAFADDVTVLRFGRVVASAEASQLSAEALAEHMVGRAGHRRAVARATPKPSDNRLEARGLTVLGDAGIAAVQGLHLTVNGGEIVGIAGVSGNGQRELAEALAGQRAIAGGDIRVHDAPFRPTRRFLAEHRIACLPEEPLHNACVAAMSVAENLALRRYDRPPIRGRFGLLSKRAMAAGARAAIGAYRIRTSGPEAPVSSLSGGNVQRLALARELGPGCNLLLASNPCFGLDFAAVSRIHDDIMAARNGGAAVLLISEDLDEIYDLADRILVMFEGRIVLESTSAPATRTAVGRAMAGWSAPLPVEESVA